MNVYVPSSRFEMVGCAVRMLAVSAASSFSESGSTFRVHSQLTMPWSSELWLTLRVTFNHKRKIN